MKSGFNADEGICWRFNNKGDRWDHYKTCPACSAKHTDRQSIHFGRCRSGRRWFWAAGRWTDASFHGLAETEEAATAAAMAAVRRQKTGRWAVATFVQSTASSALKRVNEAKRRARPAAETSDTSPVEYLYAYDRCYRDIYDLPCPCQALSGADRVLYHTHKFSIIRKTKKRVYYRRQAQSFQDGEETGADSHLGTGYIDRAKVEAPSGGYNRGRHSTGDDFHLYASIDHLLDDNRAREPQSAPDLAVLKAAMAAAHPDRGGSHEAFIEARAHYVEARRSMRGRA